MGFIFANSTWLINFLNQIKLETTACNSNIVCLQFTKIEAILAECYGSDTRFG